MYRRRDGLATDRRWRTWPSGKATWPGALVDGKGRTLYLFEAGSSGKSTCSGACAVDTS